MSRVRVNVRELISFYDEDKTARPHSNAVKILAGEDIGFGLLIDHFRRNGATAEKLSPCTTGQPKGERLDGWLKVTRQSLATTIYYQVEVKSWSFHGVGGETRPLGVNCTSDELAEFKRREWDRYWFSGRFSNRHLNKVLTPMKAPHSGATVEPLACIWTALHPNGNSEAFFNVALEGHEQFQRVWVFSMSSFLRNFLATGDGDWLTLDLPLAHARLQWLKRLFAMENDSSTLR
jgi:hypothetical protein